MSPTEPGRYQSTGAGPLADESRLAEQFRGRLVLFALRRTGNAAVAEDLAQETLRIVLQALREGRVENPAALPGFVFQTAEHLCLKHFRSAGREARALGRLTPAALRATSGEDPLAALISDERRLAVRAALERLEPADRDLLLALYYNQEDTAGLAQRLGITAGALRVRKHRILRRLAELLGDGAG
jgi:RNA polymerase sigma-70 factor (ECF subfamily)